MPCLWPPNQHAVRSSCRRTSATRPLHLRAEGSPVTLSTYLYFNTRPTISWGDGTTTSSDYGNNNQVTFTKTYANSGTYTIMATYYDITGASATSSTTVVVNDMPPTITSAELTSPSMTVGATTALRVVWQDTGTDDSHTITLTASSAAGTTTLTFPSQGAGIRFAELPITGLTAGTYTLEVTVADAADASKAAKAIVASPLVVSAPVPSPTPASRTGSVQGSVGIPSLGLGLHGLAWALWLHAA